MKIFVTGGSGFLGKELIRTLPQENHSLVALARSSETADVLRGIGAQSVVSGSLNDISNWESALLGCDAVIHCAAPVEFWGSWEKFEQEIVASTKALLQAASRHGVKRFVFLSSESVLQDRLPLMGVDESHPYPENPNSYYGKAKKLAEIAILDSQVSITRIILRPAFIWGPDSPALKQIADKAKQGAFLWVDQGNHSFEAVHLQNIVEAIRLSLSHGKDRGVYFITDNEAVTVKEFFTSYFKAMGINVPTRNLSGAIVRNLAFVVEAIWRLLHLSTTPPITHFEWGFVGMSRRYLITKAQNELNYAPVIYRAKGFELL